MKRYLLDTALLTGWLLLRSGAVGLVRPWVLSGDAATSVLVYGEVVEYLSRRPDGTRLKQGLHAALVDVTPLPLDLSVMDRYAELRLQMRAPFGAGLIGDMDTLIAATALEYSLTVVTTDGDFGRVPGLQVMLIARRTFVPISQPNP